MLKTFNPLTTLNKNLKRNFFFNLYFYKKNKEKYAAMEKEWQEKHRKIIQGTGKFEGNIYSQYRMTEMLGGKFHYSPKEFEVVGKKFPKFPNIENLTKTSTSMIFKQNKSIVIVTASGKALVEFLLTSIKVLLKNLQIFGFRKLKNTKTKNFNFFNYY
jgi:hypothetical protein